MRGHGHAKPLAATVILLRRRARSPARAEVLIGMAGPLTGKDAWFGEQLQRGAAQAVADINAAAACSASRCG